MFRIVRRSHFSRNVSTCLCRLEAVFAFVVSCVVAAGMPRAAAPQHITMDGCLSPAQTLVEPNYSINAGLGKQVGSNRLHRFGQFGLATGESTIFATAVRVSPRAATLTLHWEKLT